LIEASDMFPLVGVGRGKTAALPKFAEGLRRRIAESHKAARKLLFLWEVPLNGLRLPSPL
jgi:hypothetical protein